MSHPFLVELTHPSRHPITLIGTLHMDIPIPPSFLRAIGQADRVFFEVDYSGTRPLPRGNATEMEPELLRRVERSLILAELPGVLAGETSMIWLGLVLGQACAPGTPMDIVLWHRTHPSQREPLEDLAAAGDRLAELPLDIQREFLEQAVAHFERGPDHWARLRQENVDAWNAGRPQVADDVLGRILLDERNENWTPQLISAATETPIAVVVGASHVPGLIGLLQASTRT